MLELASIVQGLEDAVQRSDQGANFRRFLRKNPGTRKWLIASDYNLRMEGYPQKSMAFTIYPHPESIVGLAKELGEIFKRDFKDIKPNSIGAPAIGWYQRMGQAFHFAIVFDQEFSSLSMPGTSVKKTVREGIVELRRDWESKVAPDWMQAFGKALSEYVRPNGIDIWLFSDLLLLNAFYCFVAGLIAIERPVELIEWCPDEDDMGTWKNGALYKMVLINAVGWLGQKGARLDGHNLPVRILSKENKRVLDPIVRPADYLAGPLASWNLQSGGSVKCAGKYTDIFSKVLPSNKNICVLRLRTDPDGVRVKVLRYQAAGG